MNLLEARQRLKTHDFGLYIFGFMSDGLRGNPPTFKEAGVPVKTESDLMAAIPRFEGFRVFLLAESTISELEYKKLSKENLEKMTEEQEREQLAILKKKYEKSVK